jgi:hypothetical protein
MTTWDERKRRSNLRKHGVDLALAEHFDWATAIIEEDDSEAYGEQRERATGLIGTTLYVYIYTLRGGEDRAISLRPASKSEKRRYVKEAYGPDR